MLPPDLDSVLALAAACPEAPCWTAADYAAYLAPPGPGSALLRAAFVAVLPENPARIPGFAAATLRPDPEAPADRPTKSSPTPLVCELDSLAVSPEARRRGLGSALLRAVLGWAAERGAGRLVLEVRASNAAALALYERFGLRTEGRRPRYYAHPEEDALLLGTTITSAPRRFPFSTENGIEGGPPRC